MVDHVRRTRGAILEIGPGDGALTRPLSRLGRPLTAIEIDARRAAALERSVPGVRVICGDALSARLDSPVIVGNLPFHLTTPLLRALMRAPRWNSAVLLTQWEVARKRAGVGGVTMMTAQQAPWFTIDLLGRVPRSGFHPMPSVDGGVLHIRRRERPLVDLAHRRSYQRFVHDAFTGPGRDIARIARVAARTDKSRVRGALGAAGVRPDALPREVRAEQWVRLWEALQT